MKNDARLSLGILMMGKSDLVLKGVLKILPVRVPAEFWGEKRLQPHLWVVSRFTTNFPTFTTSKTLQRRALTTALHTPKAEDSEIDCFHPNDAAKHFLSGDADNELLQPTKSPSKTLQKAGIEQRVKERISYYKQMQLLNDLLDVQEIFQDEKENPSKELSPKEKQKRKKAAKALIKSKLSRLQESTTPAPKPATTLVVIDIDAIPINQLHMFFLLQLVQRVPAERCIRIASRLARIRDTPTQNMIHHFDRELESIVGPEVAPEMVVVIPRLRFTISIPLMINYIRQFAEFSPAFLAAAVDRYSERRAFDLFRYPNGVPPRPLYLTAPRSLETHVLMLRDCSIKRALLYSINPTAINREKLAKIGIFTPSEEISESGEPKYLMYKPNLQILATGDLMSSLSCADAPMLPSSEAVAGLEEQSQNKITSNENCSKNTVKRAHIKCTTSKKSNAVISHEELMRNTVLPIEWSRDAVDAVGLADAVGAEGAADTGDAADAGDAIDAGDAADAPNGALPPNSVEKPHLSSPTSNTVVQLVRTSLKLQSMPLENPRQAPSTPNRSELLRDPTNAFQRKDLSKQLLRPATDAFPKLCDECPQFTAWWQKKPRRFFRHNGKRYLFSAKAGWTCVGYIPQKPSFLKACPAKPRKVKNPEEQKKRKLLVTKARVALKLEKELKSA